MEALIAIISIIILVISIIALVKFFRLCADVREIRDNMSQGNSTEGWVPREDVPLTKKEKTYNVATLIVWGILGLIIIGFLINALKNL